MRAFVDLARAVVFETAYAVEWAACRPAPGASRSCRALCRVFRMAAPWQPRTFAATKRAMQKQLLAVVGRGCRHPAERVVCGGVPCWRLDAGAGRTAVYVHGGGFVGGTWGGYAGFCSAVAERFETNIVFVDYDTGGSHAQQVAAVEAVMRATRPFLALADSAGGHLLLTARVRARTTVLFSPVVDPTCSSRQYRRNGADYAARKTDGAGNPVGEAMLDPEVTRRLLGGVCGGCAPITSAPPNTIVVASENELFCGDALRLGTYGARVRLWPGVPGGAFHAWPLWDIPEAEDAMRWAARQVGGVLY